ncbi:MAG: serine O-acetyltransferase [Akkermansiaceae bacterium]
MKGEHIQSSGASENLLCAQGNPKLDELWKRIREDARKIAETEQRLRGLMDDVFLNRHDFKEAIAARLSRKLAREDMAREELLPLWLEILTEHPQLVNSMAHDLLAIHERDPACTALIQPLMFYKGYKAISTYRVSHQLWENERCALALYFQSLASEVFGVDIHPAAQIGCGIFLDHATSLVIGETAIVEDDVSILHEVTLGGTGKETGDRHPIVRSGVLIGAGAKILGRVEIGVGAKIGAGSVVLDDVEAGKTVAGVPAEVVGDSASANPAHAMDQSLHCSSL